MKKSISSKLKKALIVMLAFITMFIAMPQKSEAHILNEFVSLLLYIPDGIMTIIDDKIAESHEFTARELDFKGYDEHGTLYNFKVTPYEIFTAGKYEEDGNGNYITKLGYLDVNFFSDRPIVSETEGAVSSNILAPVIGNIYKALRNFCMVLMLLVILYIGIKILISSIAEQQAKYKRFLMDWVVGFALLFMMHYIMAGIVGLNTLVVEMLSNDEGDSYYVGVNELQDKSKLGQVVTGKNSTSTWLDIVKGNFDIDDVSWDLSFNLDNESEKTFKEHRLITINEDSEKATYADGVDSFGRLDLNNYNNIMYKNNTSPDLSKWGDNGVIYLSASLINPEPFKDPDEIKRKDRAIIKLNAMSYARVISSFSSKDNDSAIIYANGRMKETDKFDSMGYSALYLCLVIETIMFLFTYIKRVLQMAFLTMVAPIVAIMYPVDRLGDGKAQAFNQWFKDYLFNILIQPMHLLLYTVFIVAAGQLISRNIIYGLAVYAFMIPAENYFKKILGFEKASNSGGGALSKAIGGGLAMEGLGKLAGIGPAARGKGSGGSGDGKSRIRKIGKNKGPDNAPAADGTGGAPGASGGGAGGAGGAGGRAHPGRQRRGNGGNGAPGAGGAPGASGVGKVGRMLSKIPRAAKRRIAKAATGGEYSSLKMKGAGLKAAATIGKGLGRKGAKIVGAGFGGATGLVVGAATAMATGDLSNVTKGTLLGATGGSKYLGNKYDSLTGFIPDFANDLKAEVANEKVQTGVDANGDPIYDYTQDAIDMRKELRNKETRDKLDDELYDLPDSEREEYEGLIERYAQYVNIENVKDLKALKEIDKMEMIDDTGASVPLSAKEATDIYDDAQGYDVRTHRDAYMKSQISEYAKTLTGVTDAEKEKIINDIIKDPTSITPGSEWEKYYKRATQRTNNVIAAQNKIK